MRFAVKLYVAPAAPRPGVTVTFVIRVTVVGHGGWGSHPVTCTGSPDQRLCARRPEKTRAAIRKTIAPFRTRCFVLRSFSQNGIANMASGMRRSRRMGR